MLFVFCFVPFVLLTGFVWQSRRGGKRAGRHEADQLAGALQEAMLRNPGLTAGGWARAHAALGRYEHSAGGDRVDLEPLPDPPGHLVASPLEHPCVIEPLHHLKQLGFTVDWLAVDKVGIVQAEALPAMVRPETRAGARAMAVIIGALQGRATAKL